MPLPVTAETLAAFPKLEGLIEKRPGWGLHSFQSRYFVLCSGHLKYYKGIDAACTTPDNLKGDIDIALADNAAVTLTAGQKEPTISNHVEVSVAGRLYQLRAKTPEEVRTCSRFRSATQ